MYKDGPCSFCFLLFLLPSPWLLLFFFAVLSSFFLRISLISFIHVGHFISFISFCPIPFYLIPYYSLPCLTMPCYAIPSHSILSNPIGSHFILSHAIPSHSSPSPPPLLPKPDPHPRTQQKRVPEEGKIRK